MSGEDKILIVEDEQIIRNFITTILEANGYLVIYAAAGREAVPMIREHNPDLVLLDLGLPDMDGMDVLSHIRGCAELPVIVVSALR